jgi:anti-sigma B factor antagonist
MNVEKKDGVSVITLSGKLNTEAVQAMRQELYDYCGSKPGDVLVDMSRVGFVSSYLIGILVGCHRLLKDSGHRLHLAGLDSHLRTVLGVSGLTDVFPQHETEEAGVAHLRTGDPG